MLPTIRSRTQHFEFTLLSREQLVGHLADRGRRRIGVVLRRRHPDVIEALGRLTAVCSERDVALRFARLQKQWGPWGLAWWEVVLRAADQQASRENDHRGKADG